MSYKTFTSQFFKPHKNILFIYLFKLIYVKYKYLFVTVNANHFVN